MERMMMVLLSVALLVTKEVTTRAIGPSDQSGGGTLSGGLGGRGFGTRVANGLASGLDGRVVNELSDGGAWTTTTEAAEESEPAVPESVRELGGDPWTVTLQVSPEAEGDYEGVIEIMVLFDNETRSSVLLPFTRYQIGREYTFPVELASADGPRMTYLRTRGPSCHPGRPWQNLRLSRLTLYSTKTGRSFVSDYRDLLLEDACTQNDGGEPKAEVKDLPKSTQPGVDGKDLSETDFSKTFHLASPSDSRSRIVEVADLDTTDECSLDGITYANGQTFEQDCRRRCTCLGGSITCHDTCPTISSAVVDRSSCRAVHFPGRCCAEIRCAEEDARMNSCRSPDQSGSLKGELLNGLNSIRGDSRRYPWALLLCLGDDCRISTLSGVIVGDRHVLTVAPDFQNVERLRLAAGGYIVDISSAANLKTVDVRKVHTPADFANSNQSRLQLIELDDAFAFGPDLQPVNLPLGSRHCSKLSTVECPLSVVDWISAADTSSADPVRMFLRGQISNLDPRMCAHDRFASKIGRQQLSLGKSSGDERRTCLSGDECRGANGGTVVATAADDTDYLIGLIEPESECRTPTSVVLLCRYLDWISEMMNS